MGLFSRNSRRVIFGHPEVDKQIHFLETEQRLCPKLVELMEGFLWMENKTKISATHQLSAQKHISKMKEGHFQEYYKKMYWVSLNNQLIRQLRLHINFNQLQNIIK